MKKIYIIGAGPAGLMAAISAKKHHSNMEVILIDSNKQVGEKLRLTGGGRCNLTANVSNEEVVRATVKNGKFLYSALSEFGPKQIQDFFIANDCPLKIEPHNRVFPVSDNADDVINVLLMKIQQLQIKMLLNTKVIDVDPQKQLLITNEQSLFYDYLIIASGGYSYKETGSDGTGYKLAQKLGHTVSELLPAEAPLVSNDLFIEQKVLQGLSVSDVELTVYQKGKAKQKIKHDLLFTHFGLSGPVALRASFFVLKTLEQETPTLITIDFIPNIKVTELEKLCKEELIFNMTHKHNLPKRLVNFIKEQENIIKYIKKFPISIYTTRGFNNAFVTNGGVLVSEIDNKTMRSKLVNNLAFCGEIIDVNAYTGGYNITIAFATGYVAGKYIIEKS